MERPNTVAGLQAKRKELISLRKRVGACLIALRAQGLVETVGQADGFKYPAP